MRVFHITLIALLACRSSSSSTVDGAARGEPAAQIASASKVHEPPTPPRIAANFDPPSASVGQESVLVVTLTPTHRDGIVSVSIEADHECEIATTQSTWLNRNVKDLQRVSTVGQALRAPFDVSRRSPVDIRIAMLVKKRGECSVALRTKLADGANGPSATATLLVLD